MAFYFIFPSPSHIPSLLWYGSAAVVFALPSHCYLCILHLFSASCSTAKPMAQLERQPSREVISFSKQTATLYNMLSVHINFTPMISYRQDLLSDIDKQMRKTVTKMLILYAVQKPFSRHICTVNKFVHWI